MRKTLHFKLKDYKNNPEHTIKAIVHSANMGRLEEGTLEKTKQTESGSSVEVWHAVVGTSSCEIAVNKQKSEMTLTTI
ncbi:hypothetical protein CUJ83_13665 [Methanocella sp. CWC-04]|uniref:Uncharacterized protein n=1 Tax=Methanooceanicella nereidis TaxID=2052831 RepID=A0AAP2RFX4_9EURY|nr:hypothetical protein [Methanocella sp. CWC-04]MCD1296046.1 hypothetical protein [Methanocella sp. CWC-04]